MKIKSFEYPPNFAEIKQVFNPKRGVVFTYGNILYNPQGVIIPEDLLAHEETHATQQKNPQEWWDKYLKDPQFRLSQELEAYRKQWVSTPRNRQEKRKALRNLTSALSGKTYGNMISYEEAERLICAS